MIKIQESLLWEMGVLPSFQAHGMGIISPPFIPSFHHVYLHGGNDYLNPGIIKTPDGPVTPPPKPRPGPVQPPPDNTPPNSA